MQKCGCDVCVFCGHAERIKGFLLVIPQGLISIDRQTDGEYFEYMGWFVSLSKFPPGRSVKQYKRMLQGVRNENKLFQVVDRRQYLQQY